jgi:hypothetical protein
MQVRLRWQVFILLYEYNGKSSEFNVTCTMNRIVGIVDNKQTKNNSVHHVGFEMDESYFFLSYNYSVLITTMFTL